MNPNTSTLLHNQTNTTGSKPDDSSSPEHDEEIFFVCLVLGILVVLENSLVCLAFILNQKLRKKQANILVCSQACADLFNGLVFIPVEMYERYKRRQLLVPYLIAYVLFVSLFNLFSLAFDRYLAVIKPLMHHLAMDVSRTKKILLLNWILPLLISCLPLCWSSSSPQIVVIAWRVYKGVGWLFMFCLCVIMIIMYYLVYKTAARKIRIRKKKMATTDQEPENRIKTTKTELQIAHLFGLLLFFFILAYLPILYMNLMDLLELEQLIYPIMEKLSLYSLIINSAVNPVLCLLLKKDYQLVIKRWICLECTDENRGESLYSQASYKTVVEHPEAKESDSLNRRRSTNHGHSFRRLDHRTRSHNAQSRYSGSFLQQSKTEMRAKQGGNLMKLDGRDKSRSIELMPWSQEASKSNSTPMESELFSNCTSVTTSSTEEIEVIAEIGRSTGKSHIRCIRTHPFNESDEKATTTTSNSINNNSNISRRHTFQCHVQSGKHACKADDSDIAKICFGHSLPTACTALLFEDGCSFSKQSYNPSEKSSVITSDCQRLLPYVDSEDKAGCNGKLGGDQAGASTSLTLDLV